MKTVDGFIAFIETQDPERKIDHDFGLMECAIGDYAGPSSIEAEAFFLLLDEENLALSNMTAGGLAPTYGHLQQWLKENPSVSE